ncbi:hypothetical protein [Candidatus Tisiphia endosymbiont of Ceraclea dissimilis]|uniref:hypothetical protein n=1 Tax=Candidatus Tisiphia endosymbiont of Ceraclea dissimilis TaxID=3077928 RepID=UPI003CCAFFEF
MAKKQNLLKNLLTSVSVASIVASIGGSSGAFAAADIGGAVNLSAIAGFGVGGAGGALNFNEAGTTLTVDAISEGNITDITMTKDGSIIINRDIQITGKVTEVGANHMPATISNNKTLTLSGVEHTGLWAVTLNGEGSTLVLEHDAILPEANAVITTNADGKGILTFKQAGTVTGHIGTNAAALAQINIGANAAGGDVILRGDVFTRRLVFNNASEVKIAGNFGGGDNAIAGASAVNFGAGGTITFQWWTKSG